MPRDINCAAFVGAGSWDIAPRIRIPGVEALVDTHFDWSGEEMNIACDSVLQTWSINFASLWVFPQELTGLAPRNCSFWPETPSLTTISTREGQANTRLVTSLHSSSHSRPPPDSLLDSSIRCLTRTGMLPNRSRTATRVPCLWA